MNSNIHPFYSHSGKFGVHGPLLAVVAGVAVGYPLGIAYAYLIKWIPFIYLNFLITLGCGFVFGLMTLQLLKYGRVRNGPIALLTGITVGVVAWYFNWNGYIHTLVRHAPLLLTPGQVLAVRQELYKEG